MEHFKCDGLFKDIPGASAHIFNRPILLYELLHATSFLNLQFITKRRKNMTIKMYIDTLITIIN